VIIANFFLTIIVNNLWKDLGRRLQKRLNKGYYVYRLKIMQNKISLNYKGLNHYQLCALQNFQSSIKNFVLKFLMSRIAI